MKGITKIKVMFLVHTATIGGGERSLLDILTYIDKEKFHPILVCFEDGPLVKKAIELNGVQVKVIPFSKKIITYNRDKKSISQIFAIGLLGKPMIQLLIYMLRSKTHIIYSNSMKAHFIGLVLGKMTFKKVIWHVRDILGDGLNSKLFVGLSSFTDEIICISNAVSKQFKSGSNIKIIYNGVHPLKENNSSERI
ncbi:hypothetical protein SFC55_20225 [Niallia taxi]|uniref:glycosyltransferase n=1 Tax=Niallia taxi TaxID=2499688 RepID=UPI0039828F6A